MNCSVCAAAASTRVWTVLMCLRCAAEWREDEGMKATYRSLDLIPAWKLHRMREAGEPLPPEKPQAERTATMVNATKAWVAMRRPVKAVGQ